MVNYKDIEFGNHGSGVFYPSDEELKQQTQSKYFVTYDNDSRMVTFNRKTDAQKFIASLYKNNQSKVLVKPSTLDDIETDIALRYELNDVKTVKTIKVANGIKIYLTSDDGDLVVILKKTGRLETPDGILKDNAGRAFVYR